MKAFSVKSFAVNAFSAKPFGYSVYDITSIRRFYIYGKSTITASLVSELSRITRIIKGNSAML